MDSAAVKRMMPTCQNPDMWALALTNAMGRYGITTSLQKAAFLAQVGHESGDLNHTEENLNYSADALARTWPNRYAVNPAANPKVPNALAFAIARNPELIANNTYANRMGNGDVASGDGWAYRGRGLIMITGRDNYTRAGYGENPDDVSAPVGAADTAGWFWSINRLNEYADRQDIVTITRRINGGLIGLEDRMNRYALAKKVLLA